MKKYNRSQWAGLLLVASLTACGGSTEDEGTPPPPDIAPILRSDVCYLMSTTKGNIQIAIDLTNMPITGANFKRYADKQFYDGTLYHRAMSNFVIQGGGFTTGLVSKAGDSPIKNEAYVGISNERGTIAMARTPAPDSATSQFYINILDNPQLDASSSSYGFAVFGKVIEGMDVVDQISITPVHTVQDFTHVPVEDVVINSLTEMSCPASQ